MSEFVKYDKDPHARPRPRPFDANVAAIDKAIEANNTLTKEEQYKKRKKEACDYAAWEFYELLQSLMTAGFTREEAFALLLASVEGKGA